MEFLTDEFILGFYCTIYVVVVTLGIFWVGGILDKIGKCKGRNDE